MLSLPPFMSIPMASNDVMIYLVSGALFAVGSFFEGTGHERRINVLPIVPRD
jgi:hypothetical protein